MPPSKMRRPVRKFLRYKFDRYMSRGLPALVGLLVAVTAIFVSLVSIPLFFLADVPEVGSERPMEILWQTLLHALDPGTIITAESSTYRAAMLLVTFVGLVLVAGLIGIVSAAFDDRIAELRRGRSEVIEHGHTLIIGWNSKLFQIVEQLCIANQSAKKSVIVVLATREKVAMDEALLPLKRKFRGTKIVVRSGDGTSSESLARVAHARSKSVLILSPEHDQHPDFWVLKVALALTKNPDRKEGPYNIVGELRSRDSLETAVLIGEGEARWLVEPDILARLLVQTCRSAGLTRVVRDLLDYEGNEIYLKNAPQLAGKRYSEIQAYFPKSTAMGLVQNGKVILNPSGQSVLTSSDEIVLLAEDDSTIEISSDALQTPHLPPATKPKTRAPEQVLILGSNRHLPLVVSELFALLPAKSSITVVAQNANNLVKPSPLLKITSAESWDARVLEDLDLPRFDHIMILPYRDSMSTDRADSITLLTLLQLRRLATELVCHFNIVSEMLIDANRELAEVSDTSDFIVGDELIGLMMAQVSEEPRLAEIFEQLFQSGGVQIELERITALHPGDSAKTFLGLYDSANSRQETALGVVVKQDGGRKSAKTEVLLNPQKTQSLTLQDDSCVVLLRNR